MKHSKLVEKYDGTLEDLAIDVANLSYDKVEEFITYLFKEILRQSNDDGSRGRNKLSNALKITSFYLAATAGQLKIVWEICKPYVKDER